MKKVDWGISQQLEDLDFADIYMLSHTFNNVCIIKRPGKQGKLLENKLTVKRLTSPRDDIREQARPKRTWRRTVEEEIGNN
jgi:hypothetical protein